MWSALFLGWAMFFWTAALLGYVLGFGSVTATLFHTANVLCLISLTLAVMFVAARIITTRRASLSSIDSKRDTLGQAEVVSQGSGREAG